VQTSKYIGKYISKETPETCAACKYIGKYISKETPTPPLGQPYVTQTRVSPPAHQFTLWSSLTPLQLVAASFLGYNQFGWEDGIPPIQVAYAAWRSLSAAQLLAAQTLGYTEASWNQELNIEHVLEAPLHPAL